MIPVDLDAARKILDFSGGQDGLKELGELQLKGAVALQNMLADSSVGAGYLADEVGMGKTYIALGAVALMRYFNPSLKVLYICPSLNVQEKWYGREYPNFIRKNVLTQNFKIRTPCGESGTPSVSCNNIRELVYAATSGYYGDIFTRMSIFSIGMGDDDNSIRSHIEWLNQQVPDSFLPRAVKTKQAVKQLYARAINYLLPRFDLVIIDEAHNFKHDSNSSARNEVLSRTLGTHPDVQGGYRRLIDRALLLSATPFDVNPVHLYNQLSLIGKQSLMPDKEAWHDKAALKESMRRFMVRRLNELNIAGTRSTRNMYRREWRSGDKVEVGFETDEHKLVTALVQKQVGEMLDKQGGSPCFQLGMLASFESYAQTARSEPVKFDGDAPEEEKSDARDRHVIAVIRDGYVDEGKFGTSLPHPKMDQVSLSVSELAFGLARKQLVFVRRVKSVGEFKMKLDDLYNDWIIRYCSAQIAGFAMQQSFLEKVFSAYREARRERDEDVSGGEAATSANDGKESLPAKSDTLFNWFFRGEFPAPLKALDHATRFSPDGLRVSLTSKSSANVQLFEFDWFGWVARSIFECEPTSLLERIGDSRLEAAASGIPAVRKDDKVSEYLQAQRVALTAAVDLGEHRDVLESLVDYLEPQVIAGSDFAMTSEYVKSALQILTFWEAARRAGLWTQIFTHVGTLAHTLLDKQADHYAAVHRVELHRQLVAQSFRTGHPFIDLYLARLRLGPWDLDEERRRLWMDDLCQILLTQEASKEFTTLRELALLDENLDLVIKSNLPDAHRRTPSELRLWLSQQLPSSAPVIGANGETHASRSVQARKFRMPGYPLALVSTDVFQEGEDLHTFCDSVVHYGLSSSPVSIEQKTGRVDRVGAAAHRRLIRHAHGEEVPDDDYIQVSFPFVRQSIEAVQVRKLCNNLNAFLGSLHEIGDPGQSIEEFVDQSVEMLNRNEIPAQLTRYLHSPYVPTPLEKKNSLLLRQVESDTKASREAVQHLQGLLAQLVPPAELKGAADRPVAVSGLASPVRVEIDSARSCGDLLLRVTDSWAEHAGMLLADVVRYQMRCYAQSTARTYGVYQEGGLMLYREAEMLVGGEAVTCEHDIKGHFSRLGQAGTRLSRQALKRNDLQDVSEARINQFLEKRFNWHGWVTVTESSDGLLLTFFMNDDRERHHKILLQKCDGYCAFEAIVAQKSLVRKLSLERLISATWLRNRRIDLVEFLVREQGDLVGRAFHPLDSMGFEELVFTAHILAAEADRLEYLLKEPDEF